MKNKIDEIFEEIVQKHEITYSQESDLQKGSLQRRNPFNPLSEENKNRLDQQREWTHSENDEARQAIPKMEGSARLRALNRLAGRTLTRKHPETGERLFLMHRGMGKEEYRGAHDHKKGTTKYETGERTSWTPKYDIPHDFAEIGGGVVSAWVPESAIVHSSNQFNSPSKQDIENKNKPFGFKDKKGRRKAGGRSFTELEEDEFIIEHNQPFLHANKDFIDDYKNNRSLETYELNDWGLKPTPNVKSKISRPTRFSNLQGEDRSQIHNDSINLKTKITTPQQEDKLAASESVEDDLNKSDSFIRRGLLLASLAGAAQYLHNDAKHQINQTPREYASSKESVEIPKTEPERAYDQAQKDAFGIAAKHLPISRNLARATIKANPELHKQHGYLLHLSPSAFEEVMQHNPDIKKDIALKHYDSLYDQHQGDRDKIFDSYKKKAMGSKKY